jgi:hypothetical protein
VCIIIHQCIRDEPWLNSFPSRQAGLHDAARQFDNLQPPSAKSRDVANCYSCAPEEPPPLFILPPRAALLLLSVAAGWARPGEATLLVLGVYRVHVFSLACRIASCRPLLARRACESFLPVLAGTAEMTSERGRRVPVERKINAKTPLSLTINKF